MKKWEREREREREREEEEEEEPAEIGERWIAEGEARWWNQFYGDDLDEEIKTKIIKKNYLVKNSVWLPRK